MSTCAKHMLGTRNKKINNTRYLTSKDLVTIEKAYRARSMEQTLV